MTPVGLHEKLEEALERVEVLDLPALTIRPIAVAVSDGDIYEPLG